eukprot:gnl/TRDRNA2_/TRDRNA2_78742_c1_seq1.p2 gnl/TRDRNA2_/TRDRNA2_78742_c1~~gnl/TRDRNA2_/TRDRNA2_78742_c1_seq1.p2  ORF type:complete len:115 (-),score=24.42 gnl/TRDRNA2_/TRDRNA2_78742_c1_seq1:109-420(-)
MENNGNVARALAVLLRKPNGAAFLMSQASRGYDVDKFVLEAERLGLDVATNEPTAQIRARTERPGSEAPGIGDGEFAGQLLLTVTWRRTGDKRQRDEKSVPER